MKLLALAAPGTLELVAAECRALGLTVTGVDSDGVQLELQWREIAHALVHLRVATRLLMHLGTFAADDGESLYKAALHIDWAEWLDHRCTFGIFASGDTVQPGIRADGKRFPGLVDHRFVNVRIKDAIADELTRRFGKRPDVDRNDPTVAILVRGRQGKWAFYLDVCDPALHMRGTRVAQTEAPLKETLAAAVVDLSQWDARQPLLDPMCGSGTLLIEAACKALRIAPGCTRTFAVERWPQHGKKMKQWLTEVRAAAVQLAKAGLSGPRPEIAGSDCDQRAIDATAANLEASGLSDVVQLRLADARALPPQAAGTVVICNPPYGERIGGPQVDTLYAELGQAWRGKGLSTVHVLSGSPEFAASFGWTQTARAHLNNGGIDTELLRFTEPR